ncbi:uncharacterized protein LOC100366348 [Saccoglossus kowalevskii]|uniref:Uncharacterized protein LOC100366348 n=1 Tax=Saccoglossus kowalevskii TaxID=10224 RepID=A0ABM0GM36_SACKO|nr:PREDICTED: uncharacterized protein LOC100366348 [Saccoglossus kowalevskii]
MTSFPVMKVILLVLCALSVVQGCWRSKNKDTTEEEETVPSCCRNSGNRLRQRNPTPLPDEYGTNHAECVYDKENGCLMCKSPAGTSQCCTMPFQNKNHPAGLIPVGEYLMSQPYEHPMQQIDWVKLMPKKADGNGYWAYDEPNESGRSYMSLHPGCFVLNSVTVDTCESNKGTCWMQTKAVLEGGTFFNEWDGDFYSGILRVI